MIFVAFLFGVSVYLITLYVQEVYDEKKRFRKRLEAIAKSSYEVYQNTDINRKLMTLIRERPQQRFSQDSLRKITMFGAIVTILANMALPILFMPMAIITGAAGIGLFGMVNAKKQRTERIRRELPGALDLMIICLGSGLGVSASFERVSHELEGSPLGEEFTQIVNETNTGIPLDEALRNFDARVKVTEVSNMVGPIIQAHKSGASIAETFQVQSEMLREKIKLTTKEKLMKIPVVVMLPMVVFILPVIFVVILAPQVLTVMKSF